LIKNLVRGSISLATIFLLMLVMAILNLGGLEKVCATPPPLRTPTPSGMTLRLEVKGSVKTEIISSQEMEKNIKSDFNIVSGTDITKTDENGNFSLAMQDSKSIDITIKKTGFLTRTLEGIKLNGTDLSDIIMWAGDVNGDNVINMEDCICIAKSFNSSKGDAEYVLDADFNKDASINMVDVLIMAKHFNDSSESYPEYIQASPTAVSPSSTSASPTPLPGETGLEIERKFALDISKIPYDLSKLDIYELTQSYISFSPEIRIRNVSDCMYFLTVKAAVDDEGMIREERNFWITKEEYTKLSAKTEGNVIYKTRYQGVDNGVAFAIDIYKGDLKGLAVYEVEFATEEEANKFSPPDWVGKDVTSDKRYKNGNLARYGMPS